MLEFIIKSAISLALLYTLFYVCLSRETFHRFNRVCLLLITLLSLVLPLVHFTVSKPTTINEVVYVSTEYISITPIVVTQAETSNPITWEDIFVYIYFAGVTMMVIILFAQTLYTVRLMRGGLRHTDEHGNTIILQKDIKSPFSVFHWIVMGVDDYEYHRQSILAHEQEHIRLGHTYDLLLIEAMKVFQWFNPFIWFLSHDLRNIHEYEADEAVINSGIDAKQYQQLLVLKAVGNRLQPFANNLRRGSLKQRIIMMYRKKSNRWIMLTALFVIPIACFAIYAFATPKINGALNEKASIIQKENLQLIVVNGTLWKKSIDKNFDFENADEKQYAKLLNINPEDIESITILKGASATAIWGDQGINGVVEINTKGNKLPPPPSLKAGDILVGRVCEITNEDKFLEGVLVQEVVSEKKIIPNGKAKGQTYYYVNSEHPGKIVGECVTDSKGIFRLKITDPNNSLLFSKDGHFTTPASMYEKRYGMLPKSNNN